MGFNMALREVEREALTAEELERMAAKRFITERVGQVRDIFTVVWRLSGQVR